MTLKRLQGNIWQRPVPDQEVHDKTSLAVNECG